MKEVRIDRVFAIISRQNLFLNCQWFLTLCQKKYIGKITPSILWINYLQSIRDYARIAIYVTRERKRAFYNPLTERRKFSSSRKCFADRDSEGTRLRFLSESRSAKQFSRAGKYSTSGSGLWNAAFSLSSDIQHFIF